MISLQAAVRASRPILGLLAIMLALLATVACGGGAGEPATSPTPAPTTTPQSPVSAPQDPGSPVAERKGTTVTIVWQPAEGALWYHVYASRDVDSCRIDSDGIPAGSDLGYMYNYSVNTDNCFFAARNVSEGYEAEESLPESLPRPYYDRYDFWVSACNSSGCSDPAKAIKR